MNTHIIDALTPAMVKSGHKVFQIHRFARDESAHLARLERWAELPYGAEVIDLGCGVGEMARILRKLRPDLKFTLVNISATQLDYCSAHHRVLLCDFAKVPVKDASFDAALLCFAIGHGDAAQVLREVRRILRRGGVLFIYDMVRVSGDNKKMAVVQYHVESREFMENAAEGFRLDWYMEPQDDGTYRKSVIGDSDVFDGTIPAIWRFIKS